VQNKVADSLQPGKRGVPNSRKWILGQQRPRDYDQQRQATTSVYLSRQFAKFIDEHKESENRGRLRRRSVNENRLVTDRVMQFTWFQRKSQTRRGPLRRRSPAATLGLEPRTLKRICQGFFRNRVFGQCQPDVLRIWSASASCYSFLIRTSDYGICTPGDTPNARHDQSMRSAESANVALAGFGVGTTGQSAQTLPSATSGSESVECGVMCPGQFCSVTFHVVWNSQVVKCRYLLPPRRIGKTDTHATPKSKVWNPHTGFCEPLQTFVSSGETSLER
jgi:hypothetical protein